MRTKLENLITRDCHCFLQQWDMVWASQRDGESAVFFLGTGKTEKNSAKNLSTKGLCSQTYIWKCSKLHLLRAAFLSLKFSLLLQQPAIAQKQMTWIPTPWNFPSQPNTTVWSLESYNCPHNNPSIACNNNLWCPQILKCFASCPVCTWTNDWWSRIFGSTLQATPTHPWSYDLCARVVVVLGLGSKAFPDLRELLLNCAICSCEKITLGSLVCSWVWSRVVKMPHQLIWNSRSIVGRVRTPAAAGALLCPTISCCKVSPVSAWCCILANRRRLLYFTNAKARSDVIATSPSVPKTVPNTIFHVFDFPCPCDDDDDDDDAADPLLGDGAGTLEGANPGGANRGDGDGARTWPNKAKSPRLLAAQMLGVKLTLLMVVVPLSLNSAQNAGGKVASSEFCGMMMVMGDMRAVTSRGGRGAAGCRVCAL